MNIKGIAKVARAHVGCGEMEGDGFGLRCTVYEVRMVMVGFGGKMDERRVKEMNEGVKDTNQKRLKEEDIEKVPAKVEVTEQGTKKRKRGHIKMIARKKPRKQSDLVSDDEHKKCLKIVTFKGTIDSEIMEKKSFIARLNKVSSPDGDYLVIYKANGNFRAFNYLMEKEMIKVISGMINKIRRLSLGDCMKLVEFAY
ncbi:hypothetical protein Tco_0929818 [Tanacetum coccineum]